VNEDNELTLASRTGIELPSLPSECGPVERDVEAGTEKVCCCS
jgi:hypothetical protein